MSGYTVSEIHDIVEHQRKYFRSGETLSIDFRIRQLKKLKKMIVQNEAEMIKALNVDLGRHETESYICDVGSIILEINEILHGLKKWAKPETHFSGLACFPSLFTKVYKMPYGVSLIISPFNFPFLLSLGVLAASIAGGNTSIIKASSKSVACTELLEKMVSQTFPEKYVKVIGGGHDVADICLDERVDKIFYTGSTKVGVHVLNKASKNLTPVALELGGENGNWCIIRKDADLKDAARKIAFFKMLNSGQVCININQVAVEEEAADKFVSELKKAFISQIGDAISNDEYPKLINRNAYEKCALEVDEYRDRVVFGGNGDPETNKYAPTIIYPVNIDEDIIKHELFNPILPILKFNNVEKLLETISEREHGLALYVFTKNIRWAKKVMSTQQFGGGCINEVCLHLMTKGVPFNGTGHSGMGAYHGEWGFKEFTHPTTVLIGSNKFNMPLREHPYSNNIKMRLLKFFEK